MITHSIGESLTNLCQRAQKELVLVAPFVKADVLDRLLHHINIEVSLTCVTRWHLDEIISGVSDIEVWDLIRERASASLLLRSDLHAKYYRADDECLIGSANLTMAALGWSSRQNLELLVPLVDLNHNFSLDQLKLMKIFLQ
jgi:hypothetical protein